MKLKKASQSNESRTLLEQANEEVKIDGLKPFKESIEEEYLNFPADFSSLPPQEVGKYLHTYTQKKVSVRSLITQYRILLDEATMELDKHKARVYKDLPQKMAVSEKELALYSDSQALKALEFVKKVAAKLALAETYYKNIDDAIFDVSRHITLNVKDGNSEMREDNVGRIKRGWK